MNKITTKDKTINSLNAIKEHKWDCPITVKTKGDIFNKIVTESIKLQERVDKLTQAVKALDFDSNTTNELGELIEKIGDVHSEIEQMLSYG